MKRALVATLSLVIILSGCSSPAAGSAATESSTQAVSATPISTVAVATVAPAKTPAGAQQDKGKIGDYEIEIVSATLAKNYDGKQDVVIKYHWTNNGKDAESFMVAFSTSVYQNGVECGGLAMLGNDDGKLYDTTQEMNKIKPGASQDIYIAYVLQDMSKISVEVSEFISLSSSTKVVKDFNIQ